MTNYRKKEHGNEIRKALGLDKHQCLFCLQSDDNEEIFGKKIKKFGLTLHYFCMLFSSGLSQRGDTDEDGISGFLPNDVLKELKRGLRLRCTFCKQKGATIGCVVGKCRTVFHFSCGIQGKTMHQFFDTFSSYCCEHRPRQTACPETEEAEVTCAICMNSVLNRPCPDTLKSPCCRGSWFHRMCIQKHATTAGLHFFKCPLCNNKDHFQEEMLRMGVHIPDQDAAWETEPNAFTDLLERYLHCDAQRCNCDKGRDYNKDGGKWEILVCDWCGSTGSHVGCHNIIKVGPDDYMCPDCYEIEKKWNNCNGIKVKRKGKKASPRTSKRQGDPALDNKGKSEYQQQGSGFRKLATPASMSDVMSEDEFSGSEMSQMLSPGSNLSAVGAGVFDSPGKHESIISPMSLSKCSGKRRILNKELHLVPSTTVTKKQAESKAADSQDEEVDVVGVDEKNENMVQTLKRKSSASLGTSSKPKGKGYVYLDNSNEETRESRRMKRKKKQHESIRRLLKLDIDMMWTDVDTSDSDSETRPKKLRRRNSARSPSNQGFQVDPKKRKQSRATATATCSSESQRADCLSELNCMSTENSIDSAENRDSILPSSGVEVRGALLNGKSSRAEDGAINNQSNRKSSIPKISLNQDLDVNLEEKMFTGSAPKSIGSKKDKYLQESQSCGKRSLSEKSKESTLGQKSSKGKTRYKMNPNQMLIKQWLEKSNDEKKVEKNVETQETDVIRSGEKPKKTTLKIRFKGKTFMMNRRIKPSSSFKENLQAGESTPADHCNHEVSHERDGKQRVRGHWKGSDSWQTVDPLASPPAGIRESMELWKEAKRMVYTERKRNFLEQRHVSSPQTFPKRKRHSRLESLIRFPDDTIATYENEHIYSNLNVKCSLAEKFEYCGGEMKPRETSSTDMSTLTFIDTASLLSESDISMPKLSPVEVEDGVVIMCDQNRNDPQISPIGDTHHCMVVNLQPSPIDIHKRSGSLSPSTTNHSEASTSDDERTHSTYPTRLAIAKSFTDIQC